LNIDKCSTMEYYLYMTNSADYHDDKTNPRGNNSHYQTSNLLNLPYARGWNKFGVRFQNLIGMRKIFVFILLSFLAVSAIIIYLGLSFGFTKENLIAIIGFYSIFSSATLLYLQLIVNLNYNRRKAAIDFAYDKIGKELFPLIKELKVILDKDLLIFIQEKTLKELLISNQFDEDNNKKIKWLVMDV